MKTIPKIKEFNVDRSKWTGVRDMVVKYAPVGNSRLLNSIGNKCCLGFYASQCGISDDIIREHSSPVSLYKSECINLDKFVYIDRDDATMADNSGFALEAMNLNDSYMYSMEDKEERLIALFEEHDITLTFTGEYIKG